MKILEPTLILDETICKNNISRMKKKADEQGLTLRPHFKTHQSHEVGRWFKEVGVEKITVSSVKMAEYFAKDGWKDITIAFPVNVLEIDKINNLASKITLNLLVVNVESIDVLTKSLASDVNVLIKVDAGYGRTGNKWNAWENWNKLLDKIEHSAKINFLGILGHSGHSYGCRSKSEIIKIQVESIKRIGELRRFITDRMGYCYVSMGDTPTCSVSHDFTGFDEMRPGNFVFYDLTQVAIGSCRKEDVAVALACPVVAKHSDRNEVIIYGGGVHFSKDSLLWGDQKVFGLLVNNTKQGWEISLLNNFMTKLSQEHGTLSLDLATFVNVNIGDVVYLIPVHSCMTADLLKKYYTTGGEVITMMGG